MIRGLVGRQAKLNVQEHMMIDALRERLFEFLEHVALDLAALNMQRGRDHGLPGMCYYLLEFAFLFKKASDLNSNTCDLNSNACELNSNATPRPVHLTQ